MRKVIASRSTSAGTTSRSISRSKTAAATRARRPANSSWRRSPVRRVLRERFLVRHASRRKARGRARYEYAEDAPSRVATIDVAATPEGFPESKLPALMRVVDRCTVHNSLRQPPMVRISTDLDSNMVSSSV